MLIYSNQISHSSPVTVASSGHLAFAPNSDVIGPLTLSAVLLDVGPVSGSIGLNGDVLVTANSTLGAKVNLGSATRTFTINAGVLLTLNAQVIGSGGLTKAGPGTLRLAGSTENLYTGPTTVTAGLLQLGKTNGVNAVQGNLDVAGGTVRLLAANSIKASSIHSPRYAVSPAKATGPATGSPSLSVTFASAPSKTVSRAVDSCCSPGVRWK